MISTYINKTVNAYSIKDGDKKIATYHLDDNLVEIKCKTLTPDELMELYTEISYLAGKHNKTCKHYIY